MLQIRGSCYCGLKKGPERGPEGPKSGPVREDFSCTQSCFTFKLVAKRPQETSRLTKEATSNVIILYLVLRECSLSQKRHPHYTLVIIERSNTLRPLMYLDIYSKECHPSISSKLYSSANLMPQQNSVWQLL